MTPFNEFNVVLADRPGLGRIHLCGCEAVHLNLGPITVCLAPEAFAQAAIMIRDAMEQLASIAGTGRFNEDLEEAQKLSSLLTH